MAVTDGMEKITKGIWIGTGPKIGSPTLVIDVVHRKSAWKMSRAVAWAVKTTGIEWFQHVENGEWCWSHGIVNDRGAITQIG